MRPRRRQLTLGGAVLTALAAGSCYNFHLVGPEDPEPVAPPTLVSVTIQYEQLGNCEGRPACSEPVVFSATWMRTGGEFSLEPVGTTHVWRGTALGVPVNFPPSTPPHGVRVRDPYLRDEPSQGLTSERLIVGGEVVRTHLGEGTPDAVGLIYIDPNGQGRNTF
jgi:hypothetical protein